MPIAVEGRKLDRFELIAELATGGMATVYLARLSGVGGFQRLVAIKRLHPHLARESEFIEMFLEEARVAARLHHPNVASVIEIGTSDEGHYIVMEYVEGDTLGRLLARAAQTGQRLPVRVGIRVLVDMLAGLHAAHELRDDDDRPLGVVHRDVSPQNVLVGVDGTSRLSDFGVARATSKLSTTRTGQLKGKLAYMAPEQARGAKDLDRRADLFASGTVLWEVLACRRLFKGEGEADTLNRVLYEPVPTVRSAAPTVPAALEAVVSRALERDRDRRYATAAEFGEALERAASVVGALGTHKDVAAHLESVLGTEISQTREVVRSWLARSEPSRHGVDAIPRAPETTAVTKVEGEGSRSGARQGPAPPSHATPPPEGSAPGQASSVSSVTAAVPAPPSVPSVPPAAPSVVVASVTHRRSRYLPWAVALVAVLVGAAGWVRIGPASRASAGDPVPPRAAVVSEKSTQAPGAPVAPPPAAPAATSAAAAPPPAEAAPSTGTSPAPSASGATPKPVARARPAAAPAPAPAPAAAPAAVPDDISRNPYR